MTKLVLSWVSAQLMNSLAEPLSAPSVAPSLFDLSDPHKICLGLGSQLEHIREFVENSLHYLQNNYIDMLFQHRVNPNMPTNATACS